jgi:hypothetical protein
MSDTKKAVREMRQFLKADNPNHPVYLADVPEYRWPKTNPRPFRVLRSRNFLVQLFDEGQGITRLTANRTMVNSWGEWADNITWEQLQSLKQQAGYGDSDAVEVFPAESEIVNVANMRHLWILPFPLFFKWNTRTVRD